MTMDLATIRKMAWIGDEHLTDSPRGLVLSFHGLGFGGMKTDPTTEELEWARAGGLVVFPYYGPWCWMNRQARDFVDELVDSVFEAYDLPADLPIIATGGSMGGCSSLLYARYAKRTVRACLAVCPVTDLSVHWGERPDVPRTLRAAFAGYPEPWQQVLDEHSPQAQVAHMPDIPYLIIHGQKDQAVAKADHSDRFVAALRAANKRVEYIEPPDMAHCGPMPLAVLNRIVEFGAAHLK